MKQTSKTPKNIKPFTVNHGTYPFDIMVFIDQSDEVVYKELNKYIDLTEEDKEILKCEGNGRTVMLEGGQTVMRIVQGKQFHETIAHEIFHCVDFLFRKIGIQLSENSDEAYAYQIEYLTKQLYEKIKLP